MQMAKKKITISLQKENYNDTEYTAEKRRVKALVHGKEQPLDITCRFDTDGFSKEQIIDWYKLMHLGRRLDEKAALYLKMAKGWSYHAPFAGHDGIQLALGLTFRPGKDFLFPYFRDLLTCLAGGLTVEEIILNGLSRDNDVAGGGRHMSNHFAKPEIRIQNVSSCTGNHSQHAVGTARAIKKFKGDEIAFYSGGESASSEGYFWEAINCATLEKLPVIFVIQNNKYGISVPVREQSANERISDNYTGMKNLKIINCDGRDPFDSWRAMQQAKEYALSGAGPAMVHADCDRIGSHSNSDPHNLYRPQEEIDELMQRDPLQQFRFIILERGLASEAELQAIEKANQEIIFRAADIGEAAPAANGDSWSEFIVPEPAYKIEDNTEIEISADAEPISYLDAINLAMTQEFRLNPKTFLWGQDVASKNKGGVFNVCKGMLAEFGNERIFNSPIAEDNIVGSANGFCRYGDDIRVVIEGAEFADYFWPAMEQLIECSHDYWRTRGQFSPNIVIRLASGGYVQGGLYHSQNLEGTFATIPGIRIVTPAFADDAIGLMRNAIRSRGVTMYLEPKFLYNFKNAASPTPPDDFVIPFGKAKVRRSGSDISVITYGSAVHLSLIAAAELEKEGISVEVVDLRSLVPLDEEAILASVKKTGRALIAHEDKLQGGFGGDLASLVADKAFKWLDAPVKRVGSKNVPVGFAKSYETAILLNKEDVAAAIREVVEF
jgi:2-oxoisovalerate dehydrogenase E1 component